MDTLSARVDLPVNQLLAYFNKAIRKITNALTKIQVWLTVAANTSLPSAVAGHALCEWMLSCVVLYHHFPVGVLCRSRV